MTKEEVGAVCDCDVPVQNEEKTLAELGTRVARLEAVLVDARREVRTDRLVVLDSEERERLVAEVVGDVLELRIDLPPVREGNRTSLLGFAAPGGDHLSAGVGVQLWADGELVSELCWWADDERGHS